MNHHISLLIMALGLSGATSLSSAEPSSPPPAPLQLVLTGPKQAACGDLVILDASASQAASFAWLVPESARPFLVVDGGRRCVFASGTPGRVTFVVAIAQGDRVALGQHTVAIGPAPLPVPTPPGPNPPGPVPPTPTPPAPDLPAGKFQLARFAYERARELSPHPARAAQARALAGSFRAVASAIAAKTLLDPEAILAQTRTGNQAALGEAKALWQPFSDRLAERLEQLHKAGRVRLAADYRVAWEEIASGLEAIPHE